MQVKLKYGLPLVQMMLAFALLWWSYERTSALERHIHGTVGPVPSFMLLVSLNAPVGILRACWYRFLPSLWDDVIFVAAIGVYWYWVALNIAFWCERRTVRTFAWLPLRVVTDVALITLGVFLAIVLPIEISEASHSGRPQYVWVIAITGLWLAWSAGLIILFGRDLYCALRKSALRAGA